jgi:hypothetical protein
LNAESRIGSGANPRTKLTEDELAAKMERMRILNAEKARKLSRLRRTSGTMQNRTLEECKRPENGNKPKKSDENVAKRSASAWMTSASGIENASSKPWA